MDGKYRKGYAFNPHFQSINKINENCIYAKCFEAIHTASNQISTNLL